MKKPYKNMQKAMDNLSKTVQGITGTNEPQKKYVWLDTMNGNFSNSWNEETHKILTPKDIKEFGEKGLRLIE